MRKFHLCKLIPLLILLLALGLETSAQTSVGIRGGLNISNYRGKFSGSNYQTKLGPVIGLVAQFQRKDWLSFQAELNYDARGSNYSRIIDDGVYYTTEYKDITESANYLNLPLLAKFDLGDRKRVFAYSGLYFGYLVSANISGTQVITNKEDPNDVSTTPVNRDYKDDIANFDMGAVFGLGGDFKVSDAVSIFVDGRYNWGWIVVAPQGGGNLFNSVWSFNVGVMYHLKSKTE